MNKREVLMATVLVLLASPALAENWVTVSYQGGNAAANIDKDSITRGSDGIVYFESSDENGVRSAEAGDCQQGVLYLVKGIIDYHDWRAHPDAVRPRTVGGDKLNYACTNAR